MFLFKKHQRVPHLLLMAVSLPLPISAFSALTYLSLPISDASVSFPGALPSPSSELVILRNLFLVRDQHDGLRPFIR